MLFKGLLPFFLTVSLVGSVSLFSRTVAEVRSDIATLTTRVTSLDNAITAYPTTGGTLAGALAIHTIATTVLSTLQSLTTHSTATGPVGEADGQTILNEISAIEPIIDHALIQIVVKKPAFQALPIGGIPALILQDLRQLKGNTTLASNALITNSPESQKAAGTALRDRISAAFDVAITAYST